MIEPNDDQGTIVRWEEHIVPILEHPDIHIRDKALLAVAWESHTRPPELQQLSFGNVEDRDDHIVIWLTRRDGRKRLLILCRAMPYFRRWIQAEHPVADLLNSDADPLEEAPPETAIWTLTNWNKRIGLYQLRRIPRDACKAADVPAELTFHDIRRTRALLLADQLDLGTSALRERFRCGSQKRNEFIKTFEDEGFNADFGPRPPIKCPECGAWAPKNQPCLWCGANR